MNTYTIIHNGDRWYNFPYKVERGDMHVGIAATRWGAKKIIRDDARRLRRGKRTVWTGTR